jgi:hypothetical protein
MALVLADRVRETTTTTGTGTISLGGPVSGFEGFSTAIGNANTTYYAIADAATGAWEVGLGTYTSSGSTLARTTVLSSSNAGAAVNFAAGTKDVFVTQPAERALYLNGAGTGVDAGAAAFTANGVVYASSTSALATGSALTYNGTALTSSASSAISGIFNRDTSSGATLQIQVVGNSVGTLGSDTDGNGIFDIAGNFVNLRATQASSRISFSANNTEQARLTSSGLEIKQSQLIGYSSYAGIGTNGLAVAGNVGIGTASPNEKLEVSGTSNPTAIRISNVANTFAINTGPQITLFSSYRSGFPTEVTQSGYIAAQKSNGIDADFGFDLAFAARENGNSVAEKMRLTGTGNVGIGTATPADKLTVNGNVRILAGNYLSLFNASNSSNSGFATDATGLLQFSSTGVTRWLNNTLTGEYMRLDSAGNLGIGTASPGVRLHVLSSASEVARFATSGADMYLRFVNSFDSNGYIGYQNAAMTFWTANTLKATLDSAGNLGIGTALPGQKLEVQDGFIATYDASNALGSGYAVRFYTNGGAGGVKAEMARLGGVQETGASSNNGAIVFATRLSGVVDEKMRLNSAGNLGIGTASPGAKLDVNGDIYARQGGNAFSLLALVNSASGGRQYSFLSNATGSALGDAGTFVIRDSTAGANRVVLDSSGNLLVGATQIYTAAFTGISVSGLTSGTGNLSLGLSKAGTPQILSGDVLGNIYFYGVDNDITAGNNNIGARIASIATTDWTTDGTTSNAALVFYTHGTTSGAPEERGRFSSDGTFRVKGAGTAGSTDAFQVAGTAPADAARITSGGELLVGTTSIGARLTVLATNNAGAFFNTTAASATVYSWNQGTTGDNIFQEFATEGSYTPRGSITYNRAGGLVAYNTTSDYRAKDISGSVVNSGALIDSVPVYMGKMKGATQERPMFIAHEVPAYAHTGEKDAVDADGKPVYQQMDASALIPVMWAEIQDLRKRLAAAGI